MFFTFIWILFLVIALVVLVKGADFMLEGAERIGLALGLSPFVIGVVIVGLGTSFPELVSSFVAVIQSQTEIVAANAIGSNIANILLVVGLAAVVGKKLSITKELIDLDLPLLSISTSIFLAAVYDGVVTRFEAVLLVATFIIYFLYTLNNPDREVDSVEDVDLLPDPDRDPIDLDGDGQISLAENEVNIITKRDWGMLLAGVVMLVLGAKLLIDSVVNLADIFGVATGAIALVAVAIGTSMPELLVSIKAARLGRSEVVLGNIFGSNAFNLLIVTGLPGLITGLRLDQPTLSIGVPALIIATLLFVISGISRRIYQWEGLMFVLLYIFFVGKLFALI